MEILVAFDRSEPARKALEYVLEEHPEADLTVLHVIDPLEGSYGDDGYGFEYLLEAKREEAEALLAEAEELTAGHGGDVTLESVTGQPAREIVEYAEHKPVDHVVIGSHGRSGVTRILLGSVAETVVRRAPVPVTVVR